MLGWGLGGAPGGGGVLLVAGPRGGGAAKWPAPGLLVPNGGPAHGLHPRFVVAKIRADRGGTGREGVRGGGDFLPTIHLQGIVNKRVPDLIVRTSSTLDCPTVWRFLNRWLSLSRGVEAKAPFRLERHVRPP